MSLPTTAISQRAEELITRLDQAVAIAELLLIHQGGNRLAPVIGALLNILAELRLMAVKSNAEDGQQ